MLLCEGLALLALDPGSGRHALGVRAELNACLAGLLVAELVVDGFAAAGGDERDVVPSGGVPDGTALAAALDVVDRKGPRIKAILSAMDRGLTQHLGTGTWDTAIAGLVAAGVVGAAEGGLRPKHEILDPGPGAVLLERLQAAARGQGDGDIRTALLLSMTGPARLLEVVAPQGGRPRREARDRIDHALDGTPVAPIGTIVRKLIAENQAAGAVPGVVG
jgi:hypothetical protein